MSNEQLLWGHALIGRLRAACERYIDSAGLRPTERQVTAVAGMTVDRVDAFMRRHPGERPTVPTDAQIESIAADIARRALE